MNMNTINNHTSILKKATGSVLVILAAIIFPLLFTSCEIDDAVPSGGGGSGSSQFIGTWTTQIQWAYTDGLRDDSYTLRKSLCLHRIS